MKRVLIIGATSAIAGACARLWAVQGAAFFLVARDGERLQQIARDLLVRGAAEAHVHVLDVAKISEHGAMLESCFQIMQTVDIALLAYGILSDQKLCQTDPAAAVHEFEINATSVVALLTVLAAQMAARPSGTIAVISSVAGDRGRASNYVYGAAKAAVTAYCEGLRARLHHAGVHVLTIKPGPVATPMTAGTKLPPLLVASPERVARNILNAIERRSSVLYTPWFWRPIMMIVRAMPEPILRSLPI